MEKFLWSLAFLIFSHVLTTSCYILQSSSGSPLPIHVFINNNYKSIRNYFSIRGKARHLEIKSGHLAYFSSDGGERSLEYVCANTTALCQFQTDVHSDKDTADVSARAEVVLPLVGMTGVLKLCSAPSHIFKKQPLIAPSEIDCHPWIIPALPHHKEGYLLYPNSEVQDGCSLEVHTWFMTKSNYQEMRLKGTTEVFVPLFNKKWDLLLYAAFNAVLAANIPSCFVKTPHSSDSEWSKLQHSQIIHQTYKFKYNITAAAKNAGEYQIKCSGMNWNEPSQKTMKLEIKKSLKVTFIQGPKITLAGGGNTIAFPSHNLSGSFMLHIYTTSPINSLTFERSGDTTLAPVASDKSQFFAEMQYSSPFDILTEYRVGIPWLTDDLNGDYEVRVTNEDQESSTLSIRIIKAKALQVLVSPTHRSVGVGVAVSFECLAIGNLVQSISWKRDFESLQNGKYSTEIQEFGDGGNRQGIRLTLLKPQLQDSGHYTCIAVNRFETKEETVQLSVWLPGSPQIDPEYQADETTPRQLTTNHGARVLNLTDEQILQEYTHNSPRSKKSLSTIIGGIVGVLICVAVLGGATAALVFGYKWYKQRSQPIGREKTSRDRLESSKGYQQTDEELGLLDEEIGQQSAQTANGELERIDDTIQLDDIGGQSCDGEGEDESTPLLDKAAKKKSKDKRSRRPREKEETKGDKERGRINKAREEKGNGDKKEKRERSASTEEQQRTPRDGDKSGKRDKEIVTERNEEGPRDTDKLEKRDREKIAKERRKGEARDTDIAGIKDRENVEKERKREKRAVDLEERDRKETTKGGQRDNNKPETKDRDEIVKEKKAKDSNQAETKDRGDGPKEGKGDTDIPETKDREGTGKERKRREGKDINQSETKDRGERVKKRNKGDIDKAEAKDREKMKEREEKEADTLEVRGIEGTVKEKKREGPRDTDKGEAREGEETVTKRKKERLRDTDIPEIEDRGTETKGKGTETKKKGAESKDRGKDETKEKGAETKDREDKVKEKKRGDKGSKWRSREKDNL